MKIDTKVLLTEPVCKMYTERVMSLRNFWIDRGGFYTMGASAYIDDPKAYPGIAAHTNIVIGEQFRDLISLVAGTLKEKHSREIITFSNKGLPGFHIFNDEANGEEASIHIDEAQDRISWECGFTDPFSFTLPICLPAAGGGLNFWDSPAPNEMKQYQKYEIGTLYVFTGDLLHQIANEEELGPDDYRITLQGHGVILDTGKVAIYF